LTGFYKKQPKAEEKSVSRGDLFNEADVSRAHISTLTVTRRDTAGAQEI